MAYSHNVNYGSMFKNREKVADTSPEYIGEVNIDGVLYFIDGWLNDSSNGKYLKLRVKRKEVQPEQQPTEEIGL